MKQLAPTHETREGIQAEVYEFDPHAVPEWFAVLITKGQAEIFREKDDTWTAKFGNKRGRYVAYLGDYILKDQFGHIFVVSQRTFAQRYKRLAMK